MTSARFLARFLWSDWTPVPSALLIGIVLLSLSDMVPESWDPGIRGLLFTAALVLMVRSLVLFRRGRS